MRVLGLSAGGLYGSVGRGRREADQLVPLQNALGDLVENTMTTFNAAVASGTLTLDQLLQSLGAVKGSYDEYVELTHQFARAGPGARDSVRWIEQLSAPWPSSWSL